MRKPFAVCLTAMLLLGSAGGAVAQERGYHDQTYNGHGNRYGKAHRGGNKAVHHNRARKGGDRARHADRRDRKRYSRGKNQRVRGNARPHDRRYGPPRAARRHSYPARRVYRGQVYRRHDGWRPVPPSRARRLHHRPGHRYYRVGRDIVLVAIATGIVVDVLTNAID